jgi:hypothetical protein
MPDMSSGSISRTKCWNKLRRLLSLDTLCDFGRDAGLDQIASWSHTTTISVPAVFTTSFPDSGALDVVRAFYVEASGKDRPGPNLREEEDKLLADYPMMTIVCQQPMR